MERFSQTKKRSPNVGEGDQEKKDKRTRSVLPSRVRRVQYESWQDWKELWKEPLKDTNILIYAWGYLFSPPTGTNTLTDMVTLLYLNWKGAIKATTVDISITKRGSLANR